MDAGYKNSLWSRKICSYNRYRIYSRYENRFLEDGSYIRNVLINGIHGTTKFYLCRRKINFKLCDSYKDTFARD